MILGCAMVYVQLFEGQKGQKDLNVREICRLDGWKTVRTAD